jgi:hypothetical protein
LREFDDNRRISVTEDTLHCEEPHMFGANAMDLSLRPPAARAGYDQGRALAEQLTEFWR